MRAVVIIIALLASCSGRPDKLASKDPLERAEGVRGLAASADQDTALKRLANIARMDPEVAVRLEATQALAKFGRSATPSLLALAQSHDHLTVRGAALRILEDLKDPEAANGLIQIWRDKPDAVGQAGASAALVAIGKAAIPALLDVATGSDPYEIRFYAFEALRKIDRSDPRARIALRPLLGDKDPLIRQLAAGFLGEQEPPIAP